MAAGIDRLLNVVIPVGASAIGLLGLLGVPAMSILYSQEFTPGASLFRYILVGDLLMVFVWVIGAPLLARGDRVLWLVLDVLFAALRWVIAALLMSRLGVKAVVVGYLAAVIVHLALNVAVYKLRYRGALRFMHAPRLAAGVALVASLSVVGASSPLLSLPMVTAAAAWLAYTVFYARRTGLLTAIQQRLARK